jgi:hypothetical protein
VDFIQMLAISSSVGFYAGMFAGTAGAVISMPVFLITTGVIFALLFLGTASGGGINLGEALYEAPDRRCLRVKRQLIEAAKNPNISPRLAKKIIEDAEALDKLAEQYKELESIWGPIGRAIFSSVRKMFKSRDLQRELEALALNDLFLKSLELKHA